MSTILLTGANGFVGSHVLPVPVFGFVPRPMGAQLGHLRRRGKRP